MPQNTTITAVPNVWTQLTDANVTAISFQNVSGYHGLFSGTTGASAPTTLAGAIRYNPGQGERAVALADMFPGISAVRLWVLSEQAISVMVSHA